MTEPLIKGIWGAEPMRKDEYQQCYIVGSPAMASNHMITRIACRHDNYGDHALGWYDIWSGETLIASMSARYVAEIHYQVDES